MACPIALMTRHQLSLRVDTIVVYVNKLFGIINEYFFHLSKHLSFNC